MAQYRYLHATATFTMYSGSFGCGKSTALVAKLILLLLGIPNNLIYLGRMDGKALRQSTLQILYELLPDQYIASRNEQQGFLRIKPELGGSKLLFGDFKDLNDLKNLPLGAFAIDQAEEVSEDVWLYLCGRLRRKTPVLTEEGKRQYEVVGTCAARNGGWHLAEHGQTACPLCGGTLPTFDEKLPKKVSADQVRHRPWELIIYPRYGFGACNPEGDDHWIYRYFPGFPNGKDELSEGMPGHEGFHADIYDALDAGFLDGDYVASLEQAYTPVPHMADRYLHGKWVHAEGLVYPGYTDRHHLFDRHAKRFDGSELLPNHLPLYEYIDPGTTNTTAVGWLVAETCQCGCEKQNFYVIDEHYEAQKPVSYHAQVILGKRQGKSQAYQITYLDSQAFSKNQMGQKGSSKEDELFSLADVYADYGVYCVPNQKSWDVGFQRLTDLLQLDPAHVHPITGELGAPHLLIANHCGHVIYEFRNYKWKKVRHIGEYTDEPEDRNDHHMDGLNGVFASQPESKQAAPDPHSQESEWERELETWEQVGLSHLSW